MKIKSVFIAISLIAFSAFAFAENERGIQVDESDNRPELRIGNQYALFIGIDSYQQWPVLQHPVADAGEVKQILTERYRIDRIFELYNEDATKENIIKTFEQLQQECTLDDSLLVYFAGHGHLDKKTNSGFLIPVDAGTDVYKQENWLPNSQVRGLVSNLKPIHILFLVDSCFSGDMLDSTRALEEEPYFEKSYTRVSRCVITSGASETVPDKSEFSDQLKSILLRNGKPYLDGIMIYNEIRLGMRKTLPMYGNLRDTGHQDGSSFILFLKDASGVDDETSADKTDDASSAENIDETSLADVTEKQNDIPVQTVTSDENEKKPPISPFAVGIHADFSLPLTSPTLSPFGSASVFSTCHFISLSAFRAGVIISAGYGFHPKAPDFGYTNNFQLIRCAAGLSLSWSFTEWLCIGFDLLAGTGCIILESGYYDRTFTLFKPVTEADLNLQYSISGSLFLTIDCRYLILIDQGSFGDWFQELNAGAGIGFRI